MTGKSKHHKIRRNTTKHIQSHRVA